MENRILRPTPFSPVQQKKNQAAALRRMIASARARTAGSSRVPSPGPVIG